MSNFVPEMKDYFLGSKTFCEKYAIDKEYITNPLDNSQIYHLKITSLSIDYCKATFLCIHGLSQYSVPYIANLLTIADQGYEIHAYDCRGFGYSSGEKY